MDELLELLLEIVLEGSSKIIEDDKRQHGKGLKAISASVLCLYALIILAVALMLILLAIKMAQEKQMFTSILMILIDLMIWVYLYKFIKRFQAIKQHRKLQEEDEFL